jgi:ribosomal protein S12 methylthiotransferase accessory factor
MLHVPGDSTTSNAIRRALRRRLGERAVCAGDLDTGDTVRDKNGLVIAAVDSWRPRELLWWEDKCRTWGVRLLCVHLHGCEAVVGPAIDPDQPGCISCWFSRFYGTRPLARLFAERDAAAAQPPMDPLWQCSHRLRVLGELAADRAVRLLAAPRHDSPDLHFYVWDAEQLLGQPGKCQPDPLCQRCGDLELDSPEWSRIAFRPRVKARVDADRLGDVRSLARRAQSAYLDPRAGIVRAVANSCRIGYGAVAFAAMPLAEGPVVERSSGFSVDYETGRAVAVVEALERYSSSRVRSRQIAVRSSKATLGDTAVDPTEFGLHLLREYTASPELLTPYTPTLEMNFIWAHSFRRQGPVLLPYQLGFYPYFVTGDPVFAIEGSTGCAVGSCVEEAIFHGALEVIERDAFLLSWYARRPGPPFDPMDCGDAEIRCRCRMLAAAGFEVLAFDITTDFGIPALWVMVKRKRAEMPFACCIGCAHTRPLSALRRALRELTASIGGYTTDMRDPERRNYARWLTEDPSRVQTMADHGLFYCLPESFRAVEFFDGAAGRTSWRALEEQSRDLHSVDLHEEVTRVIERVLRTGCDVIAVDQTPPEQRRLGLVTYKTLIPGAIPMTWGQQRRLIGLPRLDAALHRGNGGSGDAAVALTAAPHPFP